MPDAARLVTPPSGSARAQDVVASFGAAAALILAGAGQAIALAALIFSGPLADGLARSTTNFLLAAAVGILVVGWRSRIVSVMSTAQDGPAVVMVAVVAGMAAKNSSTPTTSAFLAIGLSTIVSAVVMLTVAKFKLGSVVRYLPTTVVSGFVAGTGWLLAKGGFDVMTSMPLGLADLGDVFSSSLARFWIPGLVLGLTMVGLSASDKVPRLFLSCLPVVAVGLFFLVANWRSTLSEVEDAGWLIGPFPSDAGVQLISPSELANADWSAVTSDLPGLLSVIVVSVVALLLNLTGLESVNGSRVDVDHEATTAGLANVLVAPLGSTPSFQALGQSMLARELGVTTRVVPVSAGLGLIAFALFGGQLVAMVPRFVVGGLLITVGLTLLLEWLRELLATTNTERRIFSVSIVLVIAFVGILEGIAVGLVLAIAIFVYQYSKIDPVRLAGDGNHFHSRVDRSAKITQALDNQRPQLAIYRLQGYLFFGSITQVAEQIRHRCESDSPLSAVIVDFRHVTGIDWSGYSLLARLCREVDLAGATMCLSALPDELRLEMGHCEPSSVSLCDLSATLDEALETAEQQLLHSLTLDSPKYFADSDTSHADSSLSSALSSKFDPQSVKMGETLMSQGGRSDTIHVVVNGEFSAFRSRHADTNADAAQRLRRFGPGTTIGELGILTGETRSADVVADTDADILTMSLATYVDLRTEHPDLALELQDLILRGQAQRVATLSNHLSQALR